MLTSNTACHSFDVTAVQVLKSQLYRMQLINMIANFASLGKQLPFFTPALSGNNIFQDNLRINTSQGGNKEGKT